MPPQQMPVASDFERWWREMQPVFLGGVHLNTILLNGQQQYDVLRHLMGQGNSWVQAVVRREGVVPLLPRHSFPPNLSIPCRVLKREGAHYRDTIGRNHYDFYGYQLEEMGSGAPHIWLTVGTNYWAGCGEVCSEALFDYTPSTPCPGYASGALYRAGYNRSEKSKETRRRAREHKKRQA